MADSPRYAPILRRLHWLMAILIGLGYLAIEQRGFFARGTPARFAVIQSHYWIGLAIFVLAGWRIAQRRRFAAPAITPAPPRGQAILSTITHIALYAFFIVMPILGISAAWLDGKSVFIPFTQVAIPPLLAESEQWVHTIEDLHGQIGEIFYWVIGLHIAAALYHHFIRRDDTLRRMG